MIWRSLRQKGAAFNGGNMIILNGRLRHIAERTVVNSQRSVIIVLDGVNAAENVPPLIVRLSGNITRFSSWYPLKL